MITTAAAMAFKKPAGIDEVVEGYKGEAVDVRGDAIVKAGNSALDEAVLKYLDVRTREIEYMGKRTCDFYHTGLADVTMVLQPDEINQLIPLLAQLPPLENWQSSVKTGLFLSKLIKRSYDAGYNNFNFTLDPKNGVLDYFCANVFGEKERRLVVNITGDLGIHTAERSADCDVTIKGNVGGGLAYKAHNLNIHVDGDVKDGALFDTISITALITGSALGNLGGNSSKSSIHIKKDVYQTLGMFTRDCTFIVEGLAKVHPDSNKMRSDNTTYIIGGKRYYQRIIYYPIDFKQLDKLISIFRSSGPIDDNRDGYI